MFVSEIQDRVKNIFGDTAGVQIDDPMILDWINDGQTDICRKAECLSGLHTASIVAGTGGYPYPADFIKEVAVKVNGVKLARLTQPSIDVLFPDRDEETIRGNSLYYFHWNRNVNLYPKPEISTANGLVMWYIRTAAQLTGSAQTPEIPAIFHEDLVEYCIWRALQQDEQWPAAREKKSEYDARLLQTVYDSKTLDANEYPAVRMIAGDY
jgi:hypothetical protein